MEIVVNQFDSMAEAEIIAEARRRGYTVRDAPAHYEKPGYRIGGSKVVDGPDEWMNAANNRLWQIQTGQS